MNLLTAIKSRRSIRRFTTEPIEQEKLDAIFEAARWAPSWANTQCTRFILVSDPAIKERLVDTFSSNNPARKGALEAPLLLVVLAKRNQAGFKNSEPCTDKGEYWYMFDTALAAHNLTLAAHALGLGTVHVGYFDTARVAEIASVANDEVVVEMIPLGYPAHEGKAPARKATEELIRTL